MRTYTISEITRTWQGEGPYTGYPVTLVRFTGCNMYCLWCDQPRGRDWGQEYTLPELVRNLMTTPNRALLITGGEPALQIDDHLCEALDKYPQTVFIETNGSLMMPAWVYNKAVVVVSPKGAYPVVHGGLSNTFLKYVVPGDWNSVEDIAASVQAISGTTYFSVWFQPQHRTIPSGGAGGFALDVLFDWADKYAALTGVVPSISLQTHKLLGIP